MAESVVVVQRTGGDFVKGIWVNLGFFDGVAKGAYTDSNGEAVISHSNTGQATVYVDGADKGTMTTPGRKHIYL